MDRIECQKYNKFLIKQKLLSQVKHESIQKDTLNMTELNGVYLWTGGRDNVDNG